MTSEDTSYLIQVLPRLFHKLGYNAQYFMVFPVPSAFPIPEKKRRRIRNIKRKERPPQTGEKEVGGEKRTHDFWHSGPQYRAVLHDPHLAVPRFPHPRFEQTLSSTHPN